MSAEGKRIKMDIKVSSETFITYKVGKVAEKINADLDGCSVVEQEGYFNKNGQLAKEKGHIISCAMCKEVYKTKVTDKWLKETLSPLSKAGVRDIHIEISEIKARNIRVSDE
jgi:nickel-dependent lactate racemase